MSKKSKFAVAGLSGWALLSTLVAGFLIWKEVAHKGGKWPPPHEVGDEVEVQVTIGDITFPSTTAIVLEKDWRPTFSQFGIEWGEQWWFYVTNPEETVTLWIPQQVIIS